MQITSLSQNVDQISFPDKEVILVGTAHVSKNSAELVRDTIEEHQPDIIAIELDQGRFDSLQDPDRWKNTDIFKIIKDGKAYVLLAQLALSGFQKKVADNLGIKPGEEMHAAIEVAQNNNIKLELIDREVKTTLKRAWGSAGLWSVIKIVGSMIGSLFSKEEFSESDIEEMKNADALTAMMSEFEDVLPGVKTSLIDERDSYMCEKLARIKGKKVVAVVGAGHVPGMLKKFGTDIDVDELEQLPKGKKLTKLISWGIPILVISLLAYGFYSSGFDTGKEMVIAWVLANGGFSALGALLALAHPLTILTAFFAAPITSLNPTIAAGWVCGLVEALLRKPRVSDLETIAQDVTSLSGFWQNRVSKVLLVIAFANLGSTLGTLIGVSRIASLIN